MNEIENALNYIEILKTESAIRGYGDHILHHLDVAIAALQAQLDEERGPEPLSFKALQGMNDQTVYIVIPNDFDDDLIMPSLVACNADNDDEPDEVYLTNNLGGRSAYDEVIEVGGAVYDRKPKEKA